MARTKGGIVSRRRRKKVLKLAKGYFGSKHTIYRTANAQVMKSLSYAYRDRRNKKRDFRKLWITRINAGALLLEVEQSFADALQRGRHGAGECARFDVDALHLRFGLGTLDGVEDVVESLVGQCRIAQECAERILLAAFVDAALQLDDQHAVVFHVGSDAAHACHAHQTQDGQDGDDDHHQQNAHNCGAYILKELFHYLVYLS